MITSHHIHILLSSLARRWSLQKVQDVVIFSLKVYSISLILPFISFYLSYFLFNLKETLLFPFLFLLICFLLNSVVKFCSNHYLMLAIETKCPKQWFTCCTSSMRVCFSTNPLRVEIVNNKHEYFSQLCSFWQKRAAISQKNPHFVHLFSLFVMKISFAGKCVRQIGTPYDSTYLYKKIFTFG